MKKLTVSVAALNLKKAAVIVTQLELWNLSQIHPRDRERFRVFNRRAIKATKKSLKNLKDESLLRRLLMPSKDERLAIEKRYLTQTYQSQFPIIMSPQDLMIIRNVT